MKHLYFFSFLFFLQVSIAQTNDLLVNKNPNSSNQAGFNLKLNNLWFIKNNEYFNFIADGYTLFGDQMRVNLSYYPYSNFDITIGFETLKYFGQEKIAYFLPDIQMRIFSGNQQYIFGRLNTVDNHQMSIQLYNFERMLDKRSYEYGFEYRLKNDFMAVDTWIEWENFIQKKSLERERLGFGFSGAYINHFSNNYLVNLNSELYIHHRGGQINMRMLDSHLNNAMVLLNSSLGITIGKLLKNKNRISIGGKYFMHKMNTNNTETFHFRQGKAIYGFLNYQYQNFQWQIGYWKAHKFISVKGDEMYQSYSTRLDKYMDENQNILPVFKNYVEPERELVDFELIFKKEIFKDLLLAANFKGFIQMNSAEIDLPYYQSNIQKNHFDYNFGFFLRYKFNYHFK